MGEREIVFTADTIFRGLFYTLCKLFRFFACPRVQDRSKICTENRIYTYFIPRYRAFYIFLGFLYGIQTLIVFRMKDLRINETNFYNLNTKILNIKIPFVIFHYIILILSNWYKAFFMSKNVSVFFLSGRCCLKLVSLDLHSWRFPLIKDSFLAK